MPCNCEAGCFLEGDAFCQRANFEAATRNIIGHALWHRLDDERLELKNAWLQRPGGSGSMALRCHHEKA